MKKTFIQFIDDHKIWNLDLEDLIYAKSDRNYTHFYLVNGEKNNYHLFKQGDGRNK